MSTLCHYNTASIGPLDGSALCCLVTAPCGHVFQVYDASLVFVQGRPLTHVRLVPVRSSGRWVCGEYQPCLGCPPLGVMTLDAWLDLCASWDVFA